MEVHVPLNRIWAEDELDGFATPMAKNYFIPVGKFSPGEYRVGFELDMNAKVTVHLISEAFDMVVEDSYLSSNRRIEIPFTIEQTENYYLRMYPRKKVKIIRLAISPVVSNTQESDR